MLKNPDTQTVQTPSIQSANWLYLISIVLILTLGTRLQQASFGWGLLGTEVLLILLPVVLFLRQNKLPAMETLRLRWPGWGVVILGFTAGLGLWLLDTIINGIMVLVIGYSPPTPPNAFPVTIFQAVIVFVALAIAPPICEEILFRGYIQRSYESKSRKIGYVVTALLFVFYHFRLQGLVALLPIAFGLGYMRLRTDSIWPGVAAHFANNLLAALLMIISAMHPEWITRLPINASTFQLGLLLLLLSFWGIARLTRHDEPSPSQVSLAPSPRRRFGTGAAFPLIVAGILYLTVAGLEYAHGKFPSKLAEKPLTFEAPPWSHSTGLQYEIRNAVGDLVGQARCGITPAKSDYELECRTNIKAFRLELPGSFYQSGDYDVQLSMQWSGDDLSLIGGRTYAVNDGSLQKTSLTSSAGKVKLEVQESGKTQTLVLPDNALMPDEWAWRFMALPFDLKLNQKAMYIHPSIWDEETQTYGPAAEEFSVTVTGSEPLALPAGNFIAWRVRVGNSWTAWYDVNPPHTLLKYDAGLAVFLLADLDP